MISAIARVGPRVRSPARAILRGNRGDSTETGSDCVAIFGGSRKHIKAFYEDRRPRHARQEEEARLRTRARACPECIAVFVNYCRANYERTYISGPGTDE